MAWRDWLDGKSARVRHSLHDDDFALLEEFPGLDPASIDDLPDTFVTEALIRRQKRLRIEQQRRS